MKAAGMRPELIYAYEKTGFLLNENGHKNLSPVESPGIQRSDRRVFQARKSEEARP
jgi:hypothetical protein